MPLHRTILTSLFIVCVAGCGEASMTLELGPAPHDYGYIFSSGACRLADDEAECRLAPAAGTVVELTPSEAAEPNTCTFSISITTGCVLPVSDLLQGQVSQDALQAREPTVVRFETFNRTFDDDRDGYSNYLEWSLGTALGDAAEFPADRSPDL